MTRFTSTFAVLALTGLVACASDPQSNPATCPTDDSGTGGSATSDGGGPPGTGGTGTGTGTTTQDYAPQEVAAKLHGCRKIRFQSLGNMLADRGVDLNSFGGSQSSCQTDAN
ncbi:MAG TPA: hypothetical protein ENK57_15920, partial [Polyangiaceae bacterium]|nr:hypothetical protein [Polyangiaceae bacterium]